MSPDPQTLGQIGQRLVATIEDQNNRLDEFSDSLATMKKDNTRNRRVSRALIALSLLMGVLFASVIISNRLYTRQLCHSVNAVKAGEVQLWDETLADTEQPRTPEQQKQMDDFRLRILRIHAPSKC